MLKISTVYNQLIFRKFFEYMKLVINVVKNYQKLYLIWKGENTKL